MNQKREDCYLIETGTPTLSVRLKGHERMIPWASFEQGDFRFQEERKNEQITLQFQEVQLVMMGNDLEALWKKCQMQDLRWVQAMSKAIADQWAGDCVVTRLELREDDT